MAGDRRTLRADSVLPLIMAGVYLSLLLYFKSIGGYKVVHIPADAVKFEGEPRSVRG
jgi:hypothetical protein